MIIFGCWLVRRLLSGCAVRGRWVSAGRVAAPGDDGVCASGGPVHAELLEPLADDGLASGLDGAGADEQAAGAEPVVAHGGRVVLEVAESRVQRGFLHADEGIFPGGVADAVDVAVVEVLEAGGEPVVFLVAEHEFEGPGGVVEVLAG